MKVVARMIPPVEGRPEVWVLAEGLDSVQLTNHLLRDPDGNVIVSLNTQGWWRTPADVLWSDVTIEED